MKLTPKRLEKAIQPLKLQSPQKIPKFFRFPNEWIKKVGEINKVDN